MMWDVVIFVVVVFGMFAYWLVSSLRQVGLFKTLFAMLLATGRVLTVGYFFTEAVIRTANRTGFVSRCGQISDDMADYFPEEDPPFGYSSIADYEEDVIESNYHSVWHKR